MRVGCIHLYNCRSFNDTNQMLERDEISVSQATDVSYLRADISAQPTLDFY
jgi:hypothetical protein